MLHHFAPEIREYLFTYSRVYIDMCMCVCVCVCVREYDSKLQRFALSFALQLYSSYNVRWLNGLEFGAEIIFCEAETNTPWASSVWAEVL